MKNDLLTFSEVSLAGEGFESGLSNINLSISKGQMVFVKPEPGRERLPFFDAAQGLLIPRDGQICFNGHDWQQTDNYTQSRLRGEIGRIFGRDAAWLSNLDVDENVTLRVRHHRELSEKNAYDEAQILARRLQLSELPSRRPPQVANDDLYRCQCVRALLGPPRLLLAEYPCRFLNQQTLEIFLELVTERCAEGMALVWFTLNDTLWDTVRRRTSSCSCYTIRGEQLLSDQSSVDNDQ